MATAVYIDIGTFQIWLSQTPHSGSAFPIYLGEHEGPLNSLMAAPSGPIFQSSTQQPTVLDTALAAWVDLGSHLGSCKQLFSLRSVILPSQAESLLSLTWLPRILAHWWSGTWGSLTLPSTALIICP